MKKKLLPICTLAIISATLLLGCSAKETETLSNEVEEIIEEEIVETSEEIIEAEETVEIEEEISEEVVTEEEATEISEEEVEPIEEVVETVEVTVQPQPVHTHTYVLTNSIAGTTCQTTGIDTYTCECGDSYTQANGIVGSHEYTTETTIETIHHPGQYEVIPTYACDCPGVFWTIAQYDECIAHCDERGEGYRSAGSITKEISPAYDENIEHSRTYCVNCGIEQ